MLTWLIVGITFLYCAVIITLEVKAELKRRLALDSNSDQ